MENIKLEDGQIRELNILLNQAQEFNIKLEYTDTTDMTSIPIIKSKVLKLLNDK